MRKGMRILPIGCFVALLASAVTMGGTVAGLQNIRANAETYAGRTAEHEPEATVVAIAETPWEAIPAEVEEYTPAIYQEPTELSEEPAEEELPRTLIASRDWDAEDSEILLKIAMAEAEGESTEGKALVMLVVLNRVWSEGFPNTIEEVVFQKGQFSPVAPGGRYWTTTPNEDCYRALEMVMYDGWDKSQGATFFEHGGGGWHAKNLQYLFTVGGHNFYK